MASSSSSSLFVRAFARLLSRVEPRDFLKAPCVLLLAYRGEPPYPRAVVKQLGCTGLSSELFWNRLHACPCPCLSSSSRGLNALLHFRHFIAQPYSSLCERGSPAIQLQPGLKETLTTRCSRAPAAIDPVSTEPRGQSSLTSGGRQVISVGGEHIQETHPVATRVHLPVRYNKVRRVGHGHCHSHLFLWAYRGRFRSAARRRPPWPRPVV